MPVYPNLSNSRGFVRNPRHSTCSDKLRRKCDQKAIAPAAADRVELRPWVTFLTAYHPAAPTNQGLPQTPAQTVCVCSHPAYPFALSALRFRAPTRRLPAGLCASSRMRAPQNRHLHRTRAVEHRRGHDGAALGEGQGRMLYVRAAPGVQDHRL